MPVSCWILLRMRNISDKSCRENQNIHFVFNKFFFQKSCSLWDNVEEHGTARWVADEYIHSFIHSLHFPYIHMQVEYQGCGDCHSCCNNMCQSYKCQMFQYTYNYNYNNNFIFRTVTTKCVLLPVLYLISRIEIMYEIISLLRIIFFCPPIYLSIFPVLWQLSLSSGTQTIPFCLSPPQIHNIHSLSRKNDVIRTSLMWI